jgi:diguanylate cyclase (GGDEF)-like protein
MPSTTLNGAKQVADEVRVAVESETFTANDIKFNVTISIGIACMGAANPIDFDDLIKKADFALYEAKHFGRNRICVYSSENTPE